MASAYRFSATSGNKDATKSDLTAKSRTGLNSISAAGGGGAPYGRAALQPGSRGYYFPGFGGAPQAGGSPAPAAAPLAGAPPPTPEPAPTIGAAAPAAAVPAPRAPEPVVPFELQPQNARQGSVAEGSAVGGSESVNPDGGGVYSGGGGLPDLGISGSTVGKYGGGALGGLVAGPPGALLGALAGYAIGKAFDGNSGPGTQTMGDLSNVDLSYNNDPSTASGPIGVGPTETPPTSFGSTDGFGGFGGTAPGGFTSGDFNSAGQFSSATEPVAGPEIQAMGTEAEAEVGGGPEISAEVSGGDPDPGAGQGQEGFFRGGKVEGHRLMSRPPMPHYADGGTVGALAGPDPAGPDDGYAALDQGEFVVNKQAAAQHGTLLEQINSGGGAMIGQDAQEGGMEGYEDDDMPMGASPLAPPGSGEGMEADDAMRNVAMMPPEQRQALMMAMQDPTLSGAMMALLGPEFMPVVQMLMQPPAPQQMGGMPPGGGMQGQGAQNLASVMA